MIGIYNIAAILILQIAHFVFLMIIIIFSYNNLLDRFSTLKIRYLLRPGLELRDKCKLQTIERLSHKYCYFSALVLEILKKIYQVKLSLPVVVYQRKNNQMIFFKISVSLLRRFFPLKVIYLKICYTYFLINDICFSIQFKVF